MRRPKQRKSHLLEHIFGHNRPVSAPSHTHPRLDSHTEGKRISGSPSNRDGTRRQLDRGSDTQPTDGRNCRKRLCRALEIQNRRRRRGIRTERMAAHHQGYTRQSRAKRDRFPQHTEAKPICVRNCGIHSCRRIAHTAVRLDSP